VKNLVETVQLLRSGAVVNAVNGRGEQRFR